MDNMLSSVDEKGTMSRLNAAIALMLGLDSNQEGEIILAQEIISQSMDIDLNGIKANIELEVSDVSVSNIDSLGALSSYYNQSWENQVYWITKHRLEMELIQLVCH